MFTGIEGRIIEKYFVTSSKNNYELIKNAIVKDDSKLLNIPHYEKYLGKEKFKEFYSLPAFRSGFDETEFKNVIFNGCYPLNPIAAYLLLNISEKVAQNERTLFTFISNDEPHSMARFVSEHTLDKEWSIGADLIYEYFSALFKKDVVNEFIHNIWLSAEYAIDKCDTEDQRKIVKALAVILIVNKEDEIPATEKYLKLCINASDPEQRKCYEHEKELTKYLIERLSNNKKVKMYLPNDLENHIGIVSLTVDGFSSEDIGIILDEDFDIAVRTGYHCAPYIHKYLKDETQLGTVRVGIGQFNTKKEIDLFVKAIEEIVYE